MMSPITVAIYGEPFTGKSTIIKAAKLIVRDICMSHTSVIRELDSHQVVYSFQ